MQQRQLQKSIHPRVAGRWWEAGRGSGRGNGPGRKGIQVSPGTRLANARKELQKNLRSFQTHWCLKSILVSGRFCRTCTRDKNPDSSDRRGCGQGSWQAGQVAFQPSWLLRVAGLPSTACSLAGDGGEGSYSAEVELLKAARRETVLWKRLLFKKTKEKRCIWRRCALPGLCFRDDE